MNASLLDTALNFAPDGIRHVHVMGVCGTGMAALAGMLQELGLRVTGSDANVYPPMSDFLAKAGIAIMEGYSPANLSPRPDLVVVGNVIRAVNPEAVELGRLGIPYLSMPQALAHFFLEGRQSLVVAGTHGKTTTSSLLASTLHYAGQTPGFLIGGLVETFGRNFNLAPGPWFVVEGDEYDTAFFNKVSKFLHYQPRHAILTSIEFDHADIFTDLAAIKDAFRSFVRLIPPGGSLVACFDDPVAREISREAGCPVVSYGSGDDCRYRYSTVQPDGLHSRFTVLRDAAVLGDFQLPMPGLHNVANATAVIALLDQLGLDTAVIAAALARFPGVKRRQQIRGEVDGITVIDDFAHHPTAVRVTVAALRAAFPGRRLLIVFEPRTNTSRRAVFQQDYIHAFAGADRVLIREHLPLDSVPLTEQFSSAQLALDLRGRGLVAASFPNTEQILADLAADCRSGDVVAILSNGGFDNIHTRLLSQLTAR